MNTDIAVSENAERTAHVDALALKIAQAAEKLKPLNQCTPEEARLLRAERGNPFAPPPFPGVEIEHITMEIGSESEPVALQARIYRPDTDTRNPRPALVYFHGGGYVLGDVEQYDTVTQQLAGLSDCVVVSVDYRLAPGVKSAVIYADAFAAWQWLHAHSSALGIDQHRMAIGGDSAGGNLAIAVALSCKRCQVDQPAFQLLIYPATDYTMSMPSISEFASGFFLTRDNMEWFRAQFLETAMRANDSLVSPLYADVCGLPPALVVTAGFDPLRDEGFAFARQLAQSGVEAQHLCYTNMIHGFISFAGGLPAGMAALARMADTLRKVL